MGAATTLCHTNELRNGLGRLWRLDVDQHVHTETFALDGSGQNGALPIEAGSLITRTSLSVSFIISPDPEICVSNENAIPALK
jgi:hypothetical protein